MSSYERFPPGEVETSVTDIYGVSLESVSERILKITQYPQNAPKSKLVFY